MVEMLVENWAVDLAAGMAASLAEAKAAWSVGSMAVLSVFRWAV